MTTTLITNWTEHDLALETILGLAERSIRIVDDDLSRLKLERPERIEQLRKFLATDVLHSLQIVLKSTDGLWRDCPRLIQLLTLYSHNAGVFRTPSHLSPLNDNMFIVDGHHALIRFHSDNVRSKIIVDSPSECHPYEVRFNDIINEGCEPLCTTPLGL